MNTKYFLFLISIIILNSFISCDKIEEPFIKNDAVVWNGRKNLIIDFTGHTCGNCPSAHKTVDQLIEKYGEAIVPVAIHATYFAMPETNDTSKPFHYDFRTDIGDFYGGRDEGIGYFGELALPIGLVNSLNSGKLKIPWSWANEIANLISVFPEYNIEITSNYSETDLNINANIQVITNIKNSKKIGLIVFLTEDDIIQWQTDYSASPNKLKNYEHNHVLRAGFNGNFGDIIKNNSNESNIGDKISKSYSLKIKEDWKINNCNIVAFVYDENTKEILQVEMLKVINE